MVVSSRCLKGALLEYRRTEDGLIDVAIIGVGTYALDVIRRDLLDYVKTT